MSGSQGIDHSRSPSIKKLPINKLGGTWAADVLRSGFNTKTYSATRKVLLPGSELVINSDLNVTKQTEGDATFAHTFNWNIKASKQYGNITFQQGYKSDGSMAGTVAWGRNKTWPSLFGFSSYTLKDGKMGTTAGINFERGNWLWTGAYNRSGDERRISERLTYTTPQFSLAGFATLCLKSLRHTKYDFMGKYIFNNQIGFWFKHESTKPDQFAFGKGTFSLAYKAPHFTAAAEVQKDFGEEGAPNVAVGVKAECGKTNKTMRVKFTYPTFDLAFSCQKWLFENCKFTLSTKFSLLKGLENFDTSNWLLPIPFGMKIEHTAKPHCKVPVEGAKGECL